MIQILGLLCKYFDAVVVEVKTFFTFIQIGSGHIVGFLKLGICMAHFSLNFKFLDFQKQLKIAIK